MSVFTDTINALSTVVPPLHQSVSNANQAMSSARQHLADALDHLGNDFHQALQDKASAEATLADATRRVDELKAAALHLATIGSNVENILGIGQQVVATPDEIGSYIPEIEHDVEDTIHEAESAVKDVKEAGESNVVEFPTKESN